MYRLLFNFLNIAQIAQER